jgi:hypothetical protein
LDRKIKKLNPIENLIKRSHTKKSIQEVLNFEFKDKERTLCFPGSFFLSPYGSYQFHHAF